MVLSVTGANARPYLSLLILLLWLMCLAGLRALVGVQERTCAEWRRAKGSRSRRV